MYLRYFISQSSIHAFWVIDRFLRHHLSALPQARRLKSAWAQCRRYDAKPKNESDSGRVKAHATTIRLAKMRFHTRQSFTCVLEQRKSTKMKKKNKANAEKIGRKTKLSDLETASGTLLPMRLIT